MPLKTLLVMCLILGLSAQGLVAQRLACGPAHEASLIAHVKGDQVSKDGREKKPLLQPLVVGKVLVWNDVSEVHIQITLADGYELRGSDLAIASELSGIPQTRKGDPLVSKFKFRHSFSGGGKSVREDSFSIKLEELALSDGQDAVYAVHASIQPSKHKMEKRKERERTDEHESGLKSAWADGESFSGNHEATYFQWKIQSCVWVPVDPIGLVVSIGTDSYLASYIGNVPDGLDVQDGLYHGWCVDKHHHIFQWVFYTVQVYSSYEPLLPPRIQDENWDKVNYILNHKQGTPEDVQEAIWFFIGGGDFPVTPESISMVEDALVHGEGFVPGVHETLALVLDAGEEVQVTIIELRP